LRGCIPVLLTPFNRDRSIDFEGLDRLVDSYIEEGVEGLWVLGTGGEDMAIGFDRRLAIVEHLSRKYSGRTRLLVGCSFYALEESLAFIDRVNNLPIAAIHYMPYQFLMGLDALRANYFALADRSRHPIWLYSSDNWARVLPPDFLAPFAADPRFQGCKFSTSNAVKFEQAMRYDSEGFQVISAVVKQLVPALALGVKAFTTVEASLHLRRINTIHRHFVAGDMAAARLEQTRLNRLIETMGCKAAEQNFLRVAEIKGVLERKGVMQRWMAPGFVDVTDADIERLVRAYEGV